MRSRISTRAFVALAVVVCLGLAGVVSFYASSSPDGLNRVAADLGFDSQEKAHAAEESPLAGYVADGLGDDRLSGGLAGVVGVTVVLVVAGALGHVVRRRAHPDASDASGNEANQPSNGASDAGRV